MNPAVVVIAYNRPAALRRLLDSLERATYPEGETTPLIISIDRGEEPAASEVLSRAEAFEWRFGPKQIIRQPSRLGLVAHFQACGRLSAEHGGVIILEDDLTVAPPFYSFAVQALAKYEEDERIGGVCLYGLWFNGFTQEPFSPIEDGSDAFFLKLPYTQGLAFTASQWRAFDEWSQRNKAGPHPGLPSQFLRFEADEWFPELAYYLVARRKLFCFPRVSLTAGWGDAGAHFAGGTSWFQTPLQAGDRRFQLPELDDAVAVYDAFYEIEPGKLRRLATHLPPHGFDVDLNATKRPANLHRDYVLTTRLVRQAVATFGLEMYPPEANVAQAVAGSQISLALREDVNWDLWAGVEARRRLHAHAWSRNRPSRRRSALFAAAEVVQTARRWWSQRTAK
ncbi:MAG: glycosyltransferase [Dehalococcoidia bacterium]|nr:glycosyltransferase [Dehalococcoidia bacterium]